MKTKKGDFVEIDYLAKLKDENKVFDLTSKEEAKKEKVFDPNFDYKPLIICLGEQHAIKGLDSELIGKEVGKEYTIEISPEKGFGKKDAKMIQLVPTSIFKKQNIRPMPGLQVRIDNIVGTIKTVTGGRTLVDFNHPLSGRNLKYKVKILRILKKDEEKIKALLNVFLKKDVPFELKDSVLVIKEGFPKEINNIIGEKIKSLVKSVKKVEFKKPKS